MNVKERLLMSMVIDAAHAQGVSERSELILCKVD